MFMKQKKAACSMGRPRSFDTEKALEAAMRVFWEKGYEGASLTDLTEAMGIHRPSLYAAFGDKEALFRLVLERYAEGQVAYMHNALEEPTARKAAERLLRGAAEFMTESCHPQGCLSIQGGLACGDENDSVRRELIARRLAGETAILQRFKRAKSEGDLPGDVSPAELARYISAVMYGMSVQAAGGASRAELMGVVRATLRAWPE